MYASYLDLLKILQKRLSLNTSIPTDLDVRTFFFPVFSFFFEY